MDGRNAARAALRTNLAFWNKFFSGCIAKRVESEQFQRVVEVAQRDYPLPPAAIADVFLRPTPTNHISLDPSVPLYLQTLANLGYIDTPSILKALYKYSSSQDHARLAAPLSGDVNAEETQKEKDTQCWSNSYWVEEYMFYRLIGVIVENRAEQDSKTVLEIVRIVSKWMGLFTAVSTAFGAGTLEQLPHVREAVRRDGMESARAAFVALLLRLCESQPLIRAITKPFAKDVRKEFADSLGKFIPTLQLIPSVTERLEIFRSETLAKLDPVSKKQEAANAAMESLLDSTVGLENFFVPEIPISNARAGLYIYLHAALIARPTLDDHAFFSYLNIRYQGDNMTAASDLILASFDLLATSVFRNEIQKDAHLLKSFLINKVPLLLSQLLPPQFSGTSTEEVVKKTLDQVDQSLFPTASAMFDQSRNSNPYTESIREEFCASCVLHGLVSRDHLEQILGEDFMSNDAREKYSKEKLVGDCLADPERIRSLVGEIDKMDGNVGAVCQAIVEVIRQLCNGKETMTLKLVCSQLAQKPQALDVLLLFEKLPTVLEPLCLLLDNWRYEEDQGEYQPVYEEYGAVLLLVLAFAYRYQLISTDVGSQLPDGAVATILARAHVAREVSELTEKEKEHLNGWVQGLFDSDTGGLGDELMSSCPPKDFYLLIATLFYNTVSAYTHGHLSDESLKSGIEYLVDTFLLPSLVPAMLFLSDYLWVDSKEQKSVLKVLQLILLPKSISGEASTMLSSVKNLVAKPLEHALRTCQKRDPSNQDIEPLLRALADSLRLSRRTSGAEHNELEQWCAAQGSGLASTIKQAVRALVSWSMNPATNMMPTAYSHRQIMAGVRMLGAKRVLYLILECVQQASESGSANIVYDVATALVCAPDVTTQAANLEASGNVSSGAQRLLTLREVLKMEAEECKKIQKEDANLAEMIVRLHRRVEAQMVVPPQAVLPGADIPIDLDGEAAMAAAAAAAAAGAGMAGDAMGVDGMGLGMGLGGADMNLGGPSNGGMDVTGDGSDLFGGLDDADMGVGEMNAGDLEMFDNWGM